MSGSLAVASAVPTPASFGLGIASAGVSALGHAKTAGKGVVGAIKAHAQKDFDPNRLEITWLRLSELAKTCVELVKHGQTPNPEAAEALLLLAALGIHCKTAAGIEGGFPLFMKALNK